MLDLFSGIGGFSLGLERTGGFETVAFCEIEDFPRKVLAKHWPDVPIFEDVRLLNEKTLADAESERHDSGENAERKRSENQQVKQLGIRCQLGRQGTDDGNGTSRFLPAIDVICGGYPCQPFSHAGKRGGEKDDRHLWPEMHRLVASLRPRWVIAENVAGHISMGLDQVLSDLEGEGYTTWPLVIPACAVDAPHRRDRVWIIANAKGTGAGENKRGVRGLSERCCEGTEGMGQEDVAHAKRRPVQQRPDIDKERGWSGEAEQTRMGSGGRGKDVADAAGGGLQRPKQKPRFTAQEDIQNSSVTTKRTQFANARWWLPEPPVGRVANGIPSRVDRLKGIGNAVVPQIPEMIGYAILEAEKAALNEMEEIE